MSEQLTACPFEHPDWLTEPPAVEAFHGAFWVQCQCGVTGPERNSPEAARDAWNRRAPPAHAPCERCGHYGDVYSGICRHWRHRAAPPTHYCASHTELETSDE